MRVLWDVTAGAWIAPRLQGWGVVGGVVPRGFPAVARVLHPVDRSRLRGVGPDGLLDVEHEPVRWREAAERFGRVAHPAMQWGALSGSRDEQVPWGDDWLLDPPAAGELERPAFAAVVRLLAAATTADRWIAAVWNGWGELHGGSPYVSFGTSMDGSEAPEPRRGTTEPGPLSRAIAAAERAGHLLRLPNRDYVLIEIRPDELTSDWFDGLGSVEPPMPTHVTPNLLWPEDHAWCLATEIDFDSTLVAGERSLIEALLASAELEVVEVTDDTDLTWTGDEVNPPPT